MTIKRYSDIAHPASGYGCGFFEWVHIFFVAVVIAGLLNCCLFQIITVEQTSMMPTINDGEQILLNRSAYLFSQPQSGDIVVFYEENTDSNFIKRVIGVPNDEILITGGNVYRNGKLLTEPYINETTLGDFSITVPEDTYFCMGDNRNLSIDSRDETIGCIPKSAILGKVIFVISPAHKLQQYNHQ